MIFGAASSRSRGKDLHAAGGIGRVPRPERRGASDAKTGRPDAVPAASRLLNSDITFDVVERKHKEIAKEIGTSKLFFWRPVGPAILWFS